MATSALRELCDMCGQEWPSRFGRHNCNFHREYIHNKAIVCQPGAPLLESVERLANRLEREARRRAEGCDLSGEGVPYVWELGQVDAAIGYLKRFRSELQALSQHEHDWNAADYCSICGRDGRA
jgi:hypothetical protein